MDNGNEKYFDLKGAIVRTVAFFDLFDYPLTPEEIWRNLSVKCELIEVMEAVGEAPGKIESRNGFYFLVGREDAAIKRLGRYNAADRKFKRALLTVKIFRLIPWIKLIALGNLLGAQNLREESDIDLFIVAGNKQVWLTRFFCVGLIKLLGWRPQPGKSRDKICLSFFISDQALDLSGFMLKNKDVGHPIGHPTSGAFDLYFIYWLAGLTPLYDKDGTYKKLIEANSWLKGYLPNWQTKIPSANRSVSAQAMSFYHDIVDLFFGGLEPQFKSLQIKILPPALKSLMNLDSRVVVNDKVIKLHVNDRREEYRKKFGEKINNLSSYL